MATAACVPSRLLAEGPGHHRLELSGPHWYAAYTHANHEKKAAAHLLQRGVEHFLPTYTSIRRWKDRRVRLEMPLFPGYVFVQVARRDLHPVVQTPGIAYVVSFNGQPAALPAEQIHQLRHGLSQMRFEPHRFVAAGRRVRILSGPLQGSEGILMRVKNTCRVVLSVKLIQRSVAVEVDWADLELMRG